MIAKTIQLEILKFRTYRPFWIIISLFTLAFFAVGFSIKWLIDLFLAENAKGELSFFADYGIPLFDFVDIWQNLAYITFLFKYILAFVVIISICIEFSTRMYRQNLIDGLSKWQFLRSKLVLTGMLSIIGGVLITILGSVLGFLYSPVKSLDFIVLNLEFVLAYILEIFVFLSFALFVAVLIKRTGFAIVLFVLYSLVLEPILTGILHHQYKSAVWYFPVQSINSLIKMPFGKYIFRQVQDYVALTDVLVATGWCVIFILLSYWLLRKRDA